MPAAKTEWKRLARYLHDLGVISELDRAALAACCRAYGRWVEAEKKLKEPLRYSEHGRLWATISLVGHLEQDVELMHKFMSGSGLSPVSRSRMQTTRDMGLQAMGVHRRGRRRVLFVKPCAAEHCYIKPSMPTEASKMVLTATGDTIKYSR